MGKVQNQSYRFYPLVDLGTYGEEFLRKRITLQAVNWNNHEHELWGLLAGKAALVISDLPWDKNQANVPQKERMGASDHLNQEDRVAWVSRTARLLKPGGCGIGITIIQEWANWMQAIATCRSAFIMETYPMTLLFNPRDSGRGKLSAADLLRPAGLIGNIFFRLK